MIGHRPLALLAGLLGPGLFLLAGAGPAAAQPEKPEPPPLAPGQPRPPGEAPTETQREAEFLQRENERLRARAAALEAEARRVQELQAQLQQFRGVQDPAQAEREAQRLALTAAMRDFFQTASLVDQAVALAQAKAADLRRSGVLLSPMPEVGHLSGQLRLMQMVRDYLRGQESIAGVPVNAADQRLPAQNLVDGLSPQNALWLNSYVLERLRNASNQPGFPAALNALLHSTRLIHEMPTAPKPTPLPGILPEDLTGPLQSTPQGQTQPQLPPQAPGAGLPALPGMPAAPRSIQPLTPPAGPGRGTLGPVRGFGTPVPPPR